MIVFNSVRKSYKSKTVLHDFSLNVESGQRLVLFGPSGCGKTTVLRLLAGFISPDYGSIVIENRIVSENGKILVQPEHRNIGMVFQDLALWPHLTVRGNIEFGLRACGIAAEQRSERIAQMLEILQMDKFLKAKPAELSGGQQQRVALARALVLRPKVLLMDEPLSNIDMEMALILCSEIKRIHQQFGFTLIYVTHNRAEAVDIATHIVSVRNGRIQRDTETRRF